VSRPRIRVVGLGPGDARYVTASTAEALRGATVARLRTRVHPAAADFAVESYDAFYDAASSFDELYERIVDDLVRLAHSSPADEVVYAVPGSPSVAERTVEILRERDDVEVVCEPAVSVIDVACAALGVDPMARGLRVVDALDSTEPFRGPGPLLILQTYSPEVLATVSDRLPGETDVVVVHHLGLSDQVIEHRRARDLAGFALADHLTSLYVAGLRTVGEVMEDLVSFARRLRAECPWDMEQTHASLTRYLIEESYEAFDALTALAAMIEAGEDDATLVSHAEEELGDLLFQVVFHAELADEEGRFNLATLADATRDKLTTRHPHVFGDVVVTGAHEVTQNWETIKQAEKGRESVLDGISWWAPALALDAKVRHRARRLAALPSTHELLAAFSDALARAASETADDEQRRAGFGDALEALSALAVTFDVDAEGLLRERVMLRRREIRDIEASRPGAPQVDE